MAGAAGILTRMFGTAISGAAGFAAGTAIGPVMSPIVQLIRNDVNAQYPYIPPDPGVLAEGVAQGQVDPDQAGEWAKMHGVGPKAFAALVEIANTGPGSGFAFDLWRRGIIDEKGFRRALRRLGIEQEWIEDLVQTKDVLLTPSELANARQQGFIDQARQEAEAAMQGVTADRADIQFELSGLPPGVDVAQRAANRGLVDRATFDQMVREGHTKTKYTDLVWAMRHPVLSAAEYATLYLKGWITEQAMNEGGALTGYTPEQMHDLYLSHGRPATTHQVHIGYARGGELPGAANEREAFRTAVRNSDIRPEYEPLLWASRYTLPSAFVMRSLTQTGVWSQAKAAERLRMAGWIPEDADEAAAAWAGGTSTGTSDPHAEKAQTQLWTTTHRSYIAAESDDATATTALEAAGVDAGSVPAVLALWQQERELVRKQLTPAQIKKAYNTAAVNAETGEAWTKDEALAALIARGYSTTDAASFLNI